ncbi:hypothetical protein FAZ19_04200 [Sphingobacterium alkalisoli]|uniref:Uncharacterized protein n=1 Tax=Sphingobacterium alkalisoli TaxID=1874115 RepID=A0A4U0HAP4_9SPHI|nr:hypothetical protein [Sphingobacterium alkalisoli]TJY68464.1 hypothetical protein FAZ19_04200 [Sphingobacterium alkalisoli]GGH06335.1 hypothetical protein GCM10011418_02960 [Sphingobacterium alkalisoli]
MENNYQLSRIHNYVMGLMSKEEMYAIEREALQDPFLQDAIDGYKMQQGVDAKQLSILQQRLARRVETQKMDNNRRFFGWQRLTVALAAAVLFVVACSLVFFKFFSSQQEKKTEVILMEQQLRVDSRTLAKNDAIPEMGWPQFNEELNSEVRDVLSTEDVIVRFNVENGLATAITVAGTSSSEVGSAIIEFVRDKVKWNGTRGEIRIEIDSKE